MCGRLLEAPRCLRLRRLQELPGWLHVCCCLFPHFLQPRTRDCTTTCKGATITSSDPGRWLRGCQRVEGNLQISVDGGWNLMEQLEENLGELRVVTGYIRVYGSNTLFSLNFLRNLELIGGEDRVHDKYALYILENENLQELWDMSQNNHSLVIAQGTLFSRYNPLLCPKLVHQLANLTGVTLLSPDDVSNDSNEDVAPCYGTDLSIEIQIGVKLGTISVSWTHNTVFDHRYVIGYYVYYRETDANVTYYQGRDACNDKLLWERYFLNFEKKRSNVMLRGLRPFTRYALYVSVHNIDTEKTATRSAIHYITTPPTDPSPVTKLKVQEKGASYLVLTWLEPSTPNGRVALYEVLYQVVRYPASTSSDYNRSYVCSDDYEPPGGIGKLSGRKEATTTVAPDANRTEEQEGGEDAPKCCPCPVSHSVVTKEDRQYDIEFYDYMSSLIYIKLDDEDEERSSSTTMLAWSGASASHLQREEVVPPASANTNTGSEDRVKRQASVSWSKIGHTYVGPHLSSTNGTESITKWTSTNTTTINITGLHHFTNYRVWVRACHTPVNREALCSIWTNLESATLFQESRNKILIFSANEEEPSEVTSGEQENQLREKHGQNFSDYSIVSENSSETNTSDYSIFFSITSAITASSSFSTISSPLTPSSSTSTSTSRPPTRSSSISTISTLSTSIPSLSISSTTTTTGSNILLRWEPPENPNGPPLAYLIQYSHKEAPQGKSKLMECLMEEQARREGYTYRLKGLQPGTYVFSIKLRSLGGDGHYTTRTIQISEFFWYWPFLVALLTVGMVLFCLVTMTICLWGRRKAANPTTPEFMNHIPNCEEPLLGDTLQHIKEEYVIQRDALEINLEHQLGKGCFGTVHKGVLSVTSGSDVKVAVKALSNQATGWDVKRFLQEAVFMQDINSNFVVRLVGVVVKFSPIYVVMELMERGDLKSFLLTEAGGTLTEMKMVELALEAADGMAYLADKKLVHRDLAARNCMLDTNLTLKIGDFGLTRYLKTDYYKKSDKGFLPVRWMAPESLQNGRYSSRSDVWSYGVLLWEVVSRGALPYQGFAHEVVNVMVISGSRLECPENGPEILKFLMQQCWKGQPKERPEFIQLVRLLLPRASPDYQARFERVSFFHSSSCRDSKSTESNDKGSIASGSLGPSLEDAEHSFSTSLDHNHYDSLHNLDDHGTEDDTVVDDDMLCLTQDDPYKRMSCGPLSCITTSNHFSSRYPSHHTPCLT
ncbi:insulin receptor-like isoform X2 [Homarus americanus]|uniref:insulin receptor-like isoform X2 n=1 Tax=Homarus americanus TaxID=6706 RepID=UPI001C443372|nr:insulin receptor-like isoform X2 [Homarus americanus]